MVKFFDRIAVIEPTHTYIYTYIYIYIYVCVCLGGPAQAQHKINVSSSVGSSWVLYVEFRYGHSIK